MDITRNQGLGHGRKYEEMKRNSLPDLFKPLRDLNLDQKHEQIKFQTKKQKFQKHRHD